MCDGERDLRPSARPGHPSGVPQAVPSPARYDDTVSAQPAEREDPLDPQRILDQLPVSERGFFLDQYREAMENARDPAGWKQLRRVLRLWRSHADAARDHQLEVVQRQARPWIVDPAAIAALAVQQGIAGPVPLELDASYHLERAKVCRLDGRLYLHLVYSDGTREFSLFLRQRDGQHLTGAVRGFANGRFLRAASAGSEHLLSFETSRLTVMVATDQPTGAAERFAKAASAAL